MTNLIKLKNYRFQAIIMFIWLSNDIAELAILLGDVETSDHSPFISHPDDPDQEPVVLVRNLVVPTK
jgi:hypothetical protein